MAVETVIGNENSIHVDAGIRRFVVCIPSRKRQEYTVNKPLLPIANVFVHESEVDDYAEH